MRNPGTETGFIVEWRNSLWRSQTTLHCCDLIFYRFVRSLLLDSYFSYVLRATKFRNLRDRLSLFSYGVDRSPSPPVMHIVQDLTIANTDNPGIRNVLVSNCALCTLPPDCRAFLKCQLSSIVTGQRMPQKWSAFGFNFSSYLCCRKLLATTRRALGSPPTALQRRHSCGSAGSFGWRRGCKSRWTSTLSGKQCHSNFYTYLSWNMRRNYKLERSKVPFPLIVKLLIYSD